MNEEEIFQVAADMSAAERAAYLLAACEGQLALRERVERLLASHDHRAFMERAADRTYSAELEADLARLKPKERKAVAKSARNVPSSGVLSEKTHDASLRRFGDYELLEEIARGGMGVVFKARQRKLDRLVAVKMILAGEFATREQALRFRAEVEAAARLQHPNILRIHETGEQDGQPYFSMDYVEGGNLTALVREKPLPAKRAAGYVKTIAGAIHYAHQQGILHRDLKPSNVLIDHADQPHITDFGLAKRMHKESFLTVTGELMGSPSFMPPEQAGAKGVKVGRYSDVYSLGGILFYLVTGRPPFVADTAAETMYHVLNTEPVSPRLLNPSVPQDIATICLKCLEKVPSKRFQTAQQLADELGRFLNGEPILARPVSAPEKVWRWCRRNPVLGAAMMLTTVALSASGMFALQARSTAQRHLAERRQASLERTILAARSGDLEEAEKSIRDAELAGASVGDVRILHGQVAFQRGDYAVAIQHLEQSVRLAPESMAAQSMLLIGYIVVGNWEKAQPILRSHADLAPKTPDDYLFKGLAESYIDPAQSLATLNEAVRRRPSGMALLFRAQARASQAQVTAAPVDAQAAVADVNVVKALLPSNPVAIAMSLKAHLVAAGVEEERGQFDGRDRALDEAGADAATLQKFPRNLEAILGRVRYFKHVRDEEAMLGELRRARAESPNLMLDYYYVLTLYRQGHVEEALLAFEQGIHNQSATMQFCRVFILAELSGGPERALQEFHRQWQSKRTALDGLILQAELLLLGRKAEAIDACRRLRAGGALLPPWRNGWADRLLGYCCDLLSDNDLLAAAGSSRWNQCEAHFYIGVTKLAEGDRNAAREHFRKSVATRASDFYEYDWSSAFLGRLERDPQWPPWIPQIHEP